MPAGRHPLLLLLLLLNASNALKPVLNGHPLTLSRLSGLASQDKPTLVASSEQPATPLAGRLLASGYTGLMEFTFAAACAAVIFGPVGLPLSIGIIHVLFGFVIMQTVVSRTTGVSSGVALAVPSFEVLPFLAKFALIVSRTVGKANPQSALATILVGSILVNVLSSVLLTVASMLPVDNISTLLPPPLQAGLFAAIGWSLYLLSFDTLGLGFAASSLFTWHSARLWLPANLLGLGLWHTTRKSDSPLIFPIFILGTSALVHGARLVTGTSVSASRSAGWLMAEAVGEPCSALWRALSPSLVRWDVLMSAEALKQLVSAALFGPLVNTVLNFVLFGPMIKEKLDLKRELRSHAAGSAAAALGGGYPSYLALADTAVHRKIGGVDRLSCYAAASVGALFLVAYPLCIVVGYVPTLVIAAICVYIGVDFLYDNLIEATRTNGMRAGLAAMAVLAVCVQQDMLVGSLLGIAAAQAFGWWQRRNMQQNSAS